MKLILKAIPVAKRSKLSSNGKTYYYVSMAQDGEIIEYGCADSLFNLLKLYEPGVYSVDFTQTVYEGKVRENKQVIDIIPGK